MIDLLGRPRTKLLTTLSDKITFCNTVLLHDSLGNTVRVPGFGHDNGHVDVVGVVTSRRGWTNGDEYALVQLVDADGQPYPLCVRAAVEGEVRRLNDLGWHALVGIELETSLIPRALEGDPQGANALFHAEQRCLYGDLLEDEKLQGFVADVFATSEMANVSLASICREFEPFQVELTTHPGPPATIADDVFLLKRIVLDAARRNGLAATFMPQPFPAGFGNGLHINISLHPNERGLIWNMSLAEQYADVLARLLMDACAIFVPTANGYRRLKNREFSSLRHLVARERRDCLIRVTTGKGSVARIEVRLADALCNVHLGVATILSLLARVIEGFREGGPMLKLPETLGQAIERLTHGNLAAGYLPAQLIEVFAALKRSDVEHTDALISEDEWKMSRQ